MSRHTTAPLSALVAAGTLLLARSAAAKDVAVATAAELTSAIAGAQPGDRIVLASGTYALNASPSCNAVGTAAAPIEVVAQTPLGAKITFDTLEGFKVNGPFWHFDGLDVRGVCA
ncbi:MAG: PE-PGRS family protein, partial [Polyangiaceae bacterium]|nr:PE-PGRS family protein [Polyangiaceae bacterium]